MNDLLVKKYIHVIRRALDMIEEELRSSTAIDLLKELESSTSGEAPPAIHSRVQTAQLSVPTEQAVMANVEQTHNESHIAARKKHIEELLSIDCWPEAVPMSTSDVRLSDRDKINRANAILDMTLEYSDLEGINALDFGCGDGWTASQLGKRGVAQCWGYDPAHSKEWSRHSDATFTTSYDEIEPGFFHLILLQDVLDHCHDPIAVMSQVQRSLAPNGIVYVRNHPWCSKHAMHLHRIGLNKAFFHLFTSFGELLELGYKPTFSRPELNFREAYAWWFKDFKIETSREWTEPISDFFLVPEFKQLVIDQQQIPSERVDGFFEDMTVKFVDYKLCNP